MCQANDRLEGLQNETAALETQLEDRVERYDDELGVEWEASVIPRISEEGH